MGSAILTILLIGKSGQLGGSLEKRLAGPNLVAPDRNQLDLADADLAQKVRLIKPSLVLNTGAFHNVPLCESHADQAFKINAAAVAELARVCKDLNARLVTFSSDYVFDGDKGSPYEETDRPNPIQVYGISRLAGEQAAQAYHPKGAYIIRTCGLYGFGGAASKGGNFVDKRLADSKKYRDMEMASEQTVIPTFVEDLAEALLQLLQLQADPGIYHLVAEGFCSWYEFTRAIFEISGADTRVHPVDRHCRDGAMRRPSFSALTNKRAANHGIVLPHWRDGLQRYIRGKQARLSEDPDFR